MRKAFENLTSDRYRACGHGYPNYNQEGDYDEVFCDLMNERCGDDTCPLDRIEKPNKGGRNERKVF